MTMAWGCQIIPERGKKGEFRFVSITHQIYIDRLVARSFVRSFVLQSEKNRTSHEGPLFFEGLFRVPFCSNYREEREGNEINGIYGGSKHPLLLPINADKSHYGGRCKKEVDMVWGPIYKYVLWYVFKQSIHLWSQIPLLF